MFRAAVFALALIAAPALAGPFDKYRVPAEDCFDLECTEKIKAAVAAEALKLGVAQVHVDDMWESTAYLAADDYPATARCGGDDSRFTSCRLLLFIDRIALPTSN
ncbi:hypothetical protein [Chitiniphilus eburneus]|uniref:hypothetical protein n=1 Tax=Chitiniphilus eburneus TaxID=2571148 RepID=UPI0035CF8322